MDFNSYTDVSITFSNAAGYVAFKYTSGTSECATWQVDNIIVTGIPEPAVALILLPFLALLRRK